MPERPVSQGERGWELHCPLCGFSSVGWSSRALAEDRRRQHMAEHEGAEPAEPPRNEKE